MTEINIAHFLALLQEEVASYQVPVVDLVAVQTNDPFKVLVATILSARTKDETTAQASARLFARAPDAVSLARLSQEELRTLIYPVSFFKNKARYLAALPAALAAFGNQVPADLDKLLTLPGVGRKTANLVLVAAFGIPAVCVDTHVHRIMNIWGYVRTKDPEETEMVLRRQLPAEYWLTVNSILVAFGQGTCRPVAPHCDRCLLAAECPKLGVTPRRLAKGGKKNAAKTVRLISWNVNGIRALEKKGLVDLIQELAPDIFALQETRAHPDQLSAPLKKIAGYEAYFAPAAKKGYSGVAVYSRLTPLTVSTGLGQEEFDKEGRLLTLEFATFYLVNVYCPNAQHGLERLEYKLAFQRALHSFVDELAAQKSVILCGDFNIAHKEIDLANPKANEQNPGFSPKERAWLDEFLAAGYIDSFRLFNQEPGNYTWWSYRFAARSRNIGWRIDYFVVDGRSRERVQSAAILSAIMGSDHCPVEMEFL